MLHSDFCIKSDLSFKGKKSLYWNEPCVWTHTAFLIPTLEATDITLIAAVRHYQQHSQGGNAPRLPATLLLTGPVPKSTSAAHFI